MRCLRGECLRLLLSHLVDLLHCAILLPTDQLDVDHLMDDWHVVLVDDEVQDRALRSLVATHELSHMLDQDIHDGLSLSPHPTIGRRSLLTDQHITGIEIDCQISSVIVDLLLLLIMTLGH